MRIVVLVGLLLVLQACGGGGSVVRNPDGPPLSEPPNLAQLPDPIPRQEPKSKRGNPPTYTVHGQTYRVMDSADGYRNEGNASWYGRKFHGRTTSSGEPFDMFKLTAAHKHLPIPTYVRVTNLDNNRTTIVRVNDRGPFHPDRIIDLSYAAAVKLGFANLGTAPVRIEVISHQREYLLQAGAFTSLAGADVLRARIAKVIDHPSFVVRTGADDLYRVRIGPVQGEAKAKALADRLSNHQLGSPIVIPH